MRWTAVSTWCAQHLITALFDALVCSVVAEEEHLDHDCFEDEYLTDQCCSLERGRHGDTSCWWQLLGVSDESAWPRLFERCCLRAAFRRDRDSVLVPDIFAPLLLQPPVAEQPVVASSRTFGSRGHDRRFRLVDTGLRVATASGDSPSVSLPANASVLLNIGAHAYLEKEWLERLFSPSNVVICFEPGHTAFLKLRLWSEVNVPPVAPTALQRLYLLPLAVGPVDSSQRGRLAKLHRSEFAEGQCNSLLLPNSRHDSAWGAAGCGAATSAPETVFVVSLLEILQLLGGVHVDFVKVDAQGLDLEIIRSGMPLVTQMVSRLQVEVQDVPEGSSKLLYAGGHTKAGAIAELAKLGFELEGCRLRIDEELMEQDCFFVNIFRPPRAARPSGIVVDEPG